MNYEYQSWKDHLDNCPKCLKAIRGRFSGTSIKTMSNNCCSTGKPLYDNFVKETARLAERIK